MRARRSSLPLRRIAWPDAAARAWLLRPEVPGALILLRDPLTVWRNLRLLRRPVFLRVLADQYAWIDHWWRRLREAGKAVELVSFYGMAPERDEAAEVLDAANDITCDELGSGSMVRALRNYQRLRMLAGWPPLESPGLDQVKLRPPRPYDAVTGAPLP